MERQNPAPASVAATAAKNVDNDSKSKNTKKAKNNGGLALYTPKTTPSPSLQLHDPSQSHAGTATTANVTSESMQMPLGQQMIHSAFSVLFDDSIRRLSGRQGAAIAFELKYDTEVKRYHFVNLFYQMHVGAIGGVTCGVETGLFSKCFDPAKSAALLKRPSLRKVVRNADVFRTAVSRALVAGLLFNFLDRKMEQRRNKRDWMNFASAGLISGALFGARGGVRGAAIGSMGFGAFAALAGFLDGFLRKRFS